MNETEATYLRIIAVIATTNYYSLLTNKVQLTRKYETYTITATADTLTNQFQPVCQCTYQLLFRPV